MSGSIYLIVGLLVGACIVLFIYENKIKKIEQSKEEEKQPRKNYSMYRVSEMIVNIFYSDELFFKFKKNNKVILKTSLDAIESRLDSALLKNQDVLDSIFIKFLYEKLNDEKEMKKLNTTDNSHFFFLNYLEFQRYFILTQMMKSVPIRNDNLNILLNEYVLKTKTYESFCQDFAKGKYIHIEEEETNKIIKNDELFTLLYTYLFEEKEYTNLFYPFLNEFKYSKTFLEIFQNKKVDYLIETYFEPKDEVYKKMLEEIIKKFKEDINYLTKNNDFDENASMQYKHNHLVFNKTNESVLSPSNIQVYLLVNSFYDNNEFTNYQEFIDKFDKDLFKEIQNEVVEKINELNREKIKEQERERRLESRPFLGAFSSNKATSAKNTSTSPSRSSNSKPSSSNTGSDYLVNTSYQATSYDYGSSSSNDCSSSSSSSSDSGSSSSCSSGD